ncbi:unnamed protein product [Durusdinium trenchii]|uniref:Uncharacterized protein n=1 Tax=Durusdinium trenchii TaxID=1381693 RepID=A0ABP0SY74_9DINO
MSYTEESEEPPWKVLRKHQRRETNKNIHKDEKATSSDGLLDYYSAWALADEEEEAFYTCWDEAEKMKSHEDYGGEVVESENDALDDQTISKKLAESQAAWEAQETQELTPEQLSQTLLDIAEPLEAAPKDKSAGEAQQTLDPLQQTHGNTSAEGRTQDSDAGKTFSTAPWRQGSSEAALPQSSGNSDQPAQEWQSSWQGGSWSEVAETQHAWQDGSSWLQSDEHQAWQAQQDGWSEHHGLQDDSSWWQSDDTGQTEDDGNLNGYAEEIGERHDVAAEIEGGVARMFSVILQATLPFFRGYIWGDTLIYTTMLYFLADEAALKMASDAKGSSGFKPCIKCNNCVARGNALDGFYSIEEDDFLNFVNAPDPDVIQIQQHLARLSEESTKARLREAEKLSGWNLNRSSWMWSPDLWALLKPSRFIYDSMHVMWSNGICNQELGYFFSAACSKADLKRSHLEEFMKANWERSMNIGSELAPSSLPSLVSSKLLKSDWQDYRGDATQTLMLMPLMTYFATACMGGHESLQAEIESLVALNAIAHKLLAAKINPQKAQGLIALQQRHLQSFREAYGPSYIRPKHHYGFHIEEQVVSLGLLTDCFPTERKNKKFKSYLAPMVKRLEDFEQSILLRWMEQDLMELQNLDLTSGLEGTSVQEGGYTFSSCLRHGLLKIKADNLLFFEEADAACLVVCAIKHKETLKVIARSLCLDEHGPNKCWSTWTMEDKYVSVPLPEAMNATRTSFHSICDRKVVMLR